MRFLFLSFLLAPAALFAQNLYDPATVQEIKLSFFQNNWDAVLDSLKAANEEAYLLAKSVEINGELFDSVGVKYKGNSSYKAGNAKNPLHIELDYVKKKQDYHGIVDIKLSNCFSDPTFVREVLAYEIVRQYMDAPVANHAKVWMNGAYWGVYTNIESINKSFVKDRYYTDGDNPFFKCNPAQIGGPGTGGNYPDLVYSSADSAFYYNKYEMRSDWGWGKLLDLMMMLKNNPNNAEQTLDVDRVLWMHAFNNVLVNLDSYTGAFGQNYYLYLDENGRWLPTVWDLNMSFGAFPMLPSGALNLTQMKQMDPLTQSTNANRPLISKLLANPSWKRMYLAHLRTMLNENFATTQYIDRALEIQSLISADVLTDTKKFYTNAQFTSNINTTINGGGGGGFGTIPGLSDLMNARYTYLKANANLTPTPPTISNVKPLANSVVNVSAQIKDATAVTLAFRYDTAEVFQKTTMLDDGQHGDGAAGDGVYGASFAIKSTLAQYYIYAENANAGMFSPERAEHEFYVVAAQPPLPKVGDVVINEILADNKTGAVDEVGQHDDWLELYNNTNAPVVLSGLYLSDNASNLKKWPFPANVSIPANGYLIVWLDENGSDGPFHANFKLSGNGEQLFFSDGTTNILDEVTFGTQKADISYGRYPNGTGAFTAMPTTFNAQNSLTSKVQDVENAFFAHVYPNPANNTLHMEANEFLGKVQVLNTLGQVVLETGEITTQTATLSVGQLSQGVYCVKIGERFSQIVLIAH